MYLVILCGFIFLALDVCKVDAQNKEKLLLEEIYRNYDRRARPVKNYNESVRVNISYTMLSIDSLDEKEQVLKTYGWLQLAWQDQYLVWDPSKHGDITELYVNSGEIWVPDIVVRNSAITVRGPILDERHYFRVIVSHDGRVSMWTSGQISTTCTVDMTYFPFDDQSCYILMDSWTYSWAETEIHSTFSDIVMQFYSEDGQWDVVDTDAVNEINQFSGQKQFGAVKFLIYLRRKPQYYVYNLVLPSAMMSVMVMMIFLMPADAGEKISLGITLLLAFSVFQIIVAESMPQTSDYLPIISIYIICTMAYTACSILATVVVLVIHYHNPDENVPGGLLQVVKALAKLVCMKTFLNSEPDMEMINGDVHMNHYAHGKDESELNAKAIDGKESIDLKSRSELIRLLKNVHGDLKFLRTVRQGDDASESIKQQWVEVGRIMDRFFLAFFLVCNILTLIALFGIYPFLKEDKPSPL